MQHSEIQESPITLRNQHTAVASKITSYLEEAIGVQGVLNPDEPLIESGRMTSLQAVDLVMFLEEQFGIQIDAEDVSEDNFRSVNSVTELVMKRVRQQ